jgi:hypothetical protein
MLPEELLALLRHEPGLREITISVSRRFPWARDGLRASNSSSDHARRLGFVIAFFALRTDRRVMQPSVNFFREGQDDCTAIALAYAVYGHPEVVFPPLHGAHTSPDIGRNVLPRVQDEG